jgi:Holliday junction resolvasome RuvABC endonuclease subunit
MATALGIDCATKSGWAVVERDAGRESLLGRGVLDLSGSAGLPAEVLAIFVRRLNAEVPLSALPVAIELPYLARGKAMNVVVLRTLARLCGRWEQALGVYGADVELVMADAWQRRILGRFGGRKRADRKKAAKLWASGTFGARFTEDEADAVAIATDLLRERDVAAKLAAAAAIGR